MEKGKNGGRGTRRLAIQKNGVDIARVIPGKMDDGKLDIKVTFLQHEFEVYAYQLLHINPFIMVPDESEGKNITYHHGVDGKDPVIHVKSENVPVEGPRYVNLPLAKIVPPSKDTLVPLPLFKLEVPDSIASGAKRRKGKKRPGKVVFDMGGNCDVVEVYMTSHENNFQKMLRTFPDLLTVLMTASFEAWSSNSASVNESKVAAIPHGGPVNCISVVDVGDIDLVLIRYPQPFMPRSSAIRATFLENALAESIMLNSQLVVTRDGSHCMTKCAGLDDIRMPDFLRVGNSRCNDIWVRAMRGGSLALDVYRAFTHRVDDGRLELLRAIQERDSDLSQRVAGLNELLNALSNDARLADAADSAARHVALAEMLSSVPALIHSTRITSEVLGVDEIYSFLTVGDDVDVHFDIARLCDLAGVPLKDRACRTEGRPFGDGLAGLRTQMGLLGFRCSATETSILLPGAGGDPPLVVPLYAGSGVVGTYLDMQREQKDALKSVVGDDLEFFLQSLEGLSIEPGLYVMEVGDSVQMGDKRQFPSKSKGRIDEERWNALVSSSRSYTRAYRNLKSALVAVDESSNEFRNSCTSDAVTRAYRSGVGRDAIVGRAEAFVVALSGSIRRFRAPAASFIGCPGEWGDICTYLGVDESLVQVLAFMSDLALYALNTKGVFSGIEGAKGAGEYLFSGKAPMVQWDWWSDDAHRFLDGVQGQHVDVVSIADDAVKAIHGLWDCAMASRAEELFSVSMNYVEMKRDFGVQGDLLVMHITPGATGANGVWADSVDFNALSDALGDVKEIGERMDEGGSVRSGDAGGIGSPIEIDTDSAEVLANRVAGAADEQGEDSGRRKRSARKPLV